MNKKTKLNIPVLDLLFVPMWLLTVMNINTFHIVEILQVVVFFCLLLKRKITYSFFVVFQSVFVALCFTSVLWARYPSISAYRAVTVVQTTIVAFSSMLYVDSEESMQKIKKLIVATAVLYLLDMFRSYSVVSLLQGEFKTAERISAFGINANLISEILSFSFLIMISSLRQSKHKVVVLLMAMLFVLGTFLTGSKKGFLICAIGVFLLILLYSSNPQKLIRNALLAGICVVVLLVLVIQVPAFYNIIGYRLEFMLLYVRGQDTDKSTWARSQLISLAREIFLKNPIAGVGVGNFQYMNSFNLYAHNNYYELLANLGLLGLIAYYFPYVNVLYRLFSRRFLWGDRNVNFTAVFFVCIMLIDYGSVSYISDVLALLIGAFFSYAKLLQKQPIFHTAIQRNNSFSELVPDH